MRQFEVWCVNPHNGHSWLIASFFDATHANNSALNLRSANPDREFEVRERYTPRIGPTLGIVAL